MHLKEEQNRGDCILFFPASVLMVLSCIRFISASIESGMKNDFSQEDSFVEFCGFCAPKVEGEGICSKNCLNVALRAMAQFFSFL
jgi:hypothetical protein